MYVEVVCGLICVSIDTHMPWHLHVRGQPWESVLIFLLVHNRVSSSPLSTGLAGPGDSLTSACCILSSCRNTAITDMHYSVWILCESQGLEFTSTHLHGVTLPTEPFPHLPKGKL